ncbi:site-specific recombinases [Pelotomaculum thermopropionicum SI]|uniref:Site-specific recombinases n=1 Tax=Pelotomaculum thermopropionicum (strain DSM 13744 / JCM 10971 / SI) TaxID=370438 RepID=A5D4E3_PELTS|nr:site-specific recombinases [Pelotomaculum thermopropionicum SI]
MSAALIYLRVSTEEQAERGYSIAAQREECRARAQESGATEIIEFVDEGVSGSILERPALVAALEKLKAGGIRWFICLDTSRLSRSVAHQLLLIDEIKKAGTELIFVNSRFTDTPEDRFHLTVLSAVDEYERARTRLRSLIGKRAKAKAGKLTHSPGLYGYEFDKETDTLRIIEEEAKIIRLMYQWFASGEDASPYKIANRLNAMGIPSPRGKRWSKQTVKRILANSAYAGTLYISRYDTKDVKFNKYKPPEERVSRKERPREEWVPISVPAIVDKQTWEAAQKRFENSRRRWRSFSTYPYLLSGLMRCGKCGATMHGNLVTSKGKKRAYYVCTAKSPGLPGRQHCQSSYLNAAEIEEVIWQKVSAWLTNPEKLRTELQAAFPDETAQALETELDAVEKELVRAYEERSRVATMFQKGFIPEAEMEERLGEIKGRRDYLSRRREQILGELSRCDLAARELKRLEELAAGMGNALDSLSSEEKKCLINLLIAEIAVFGRRADIRARIPDAVPENIEAFAVESSFFGRHDTACSGP